MIEQKRIVTIEDYNRLMDILGPAETKREVPPHVEQILKLLRGAELVDQQEIGRNVVTMNSKTLLKSLTNGRQAELTLTYPTEANPINSRISVLSNIGVALLGIKVGETVTWQTPVGRGEFCVEEVLYQPEAAKEFQL
ncbi:MAG TPA: GreA/GreB family elongation factor [Cyclobacteriaceae bacterium]|jgi:regulator of nucleoside diphosphate kinase|nr:GreA/GreB family elongation factor [Cyclobacteriaceae bacterium]HNP08001.1 GreA/GreB family elongation factor [Cyclobacteriaceae bacterium]HRK54166.1 GreA/GreB family elongation factor [Cyclobacteriaceae bacterium]